MSLPLTSQPTDLTGHRFIWLQGRAACPAATGLLLSTVLQTEGTLHQLTVQSAHVSPAQPGLEKHGHSMK